MRFFNFTLFFFLSVSTNVYSSALLTLEQAISYAHRYNPELKVAIAQSNETRGLFLQSKLYPNPSLSLLGENLGVSKSNSGNNQNSSLGNSYNLQNLAENSAEPPQTTLTIAQPIPLGNRLKYLQNKTRADYQSSIYAIKTQESNLYILVGLAFIDSLYAQELHRVSKKLTHLHAIIVEGARKRLKAGAGSEMDFRLAEVKLAKAKLQERNAAGMIRLAQGQLERLIGLNIVKNRKLTDFGLKHFKFSWALIEKKIPCSPWITEKQQQLRTQRAAITSIQKNVWPDLIVTAGGRHFADNNAYAGVVGVSASLPIFDRNQGKVIAGEAKYTQIIHEMKGALLNLKQNLYENFLKAEQNYREFSEVKHKLLPLARKAVSLGNKGYNQGRFTYTELSNALFILYEEEQHYLTAYREYNKASIQIQGLLGLNSQGSKNGANCI
ncbi:MAG: TolC family protein [Tatlockia sp.]|nr:TolC family protein [Tatlockia sp.]